MRGLVKAEVGVSNKLNINLHSLFIIYKYLNIFGTQ